MTYENIPAELTGYFGKLKILKAHVQVLMLISLVLILLTVESQKASNGNLTKFSQSLQPLLLGML